MPISAEASAPGGVYVQGGKLIDDLDGQARPVLDLAEMPRLPGRHNGQNAAASYAAARALGLDAAPRSPAIKSFPGLAHRQELIAEIDGVRYVNDSKATNADAAEKALACYADIYWIAGGQPKEDGIAGLAPLFPRIRRAFLIGEAAHAFAKTLAGRVAFEISGNARPGGRGGAPSRARRAPPRRGGAAVAGLRLVRPVQGFRGARRAFPRPGGETAREARVNFARTDKSAVAQWWWSVDRWTLLALAALVGFGSLLVMAASPSVAEHIGVDHCISCGAISPCCRRRWR